MAEEVEVKKSGNGLVIVLLVLVILLLVGVGVLVALLMSGGLSNDGSKSSPEAVQETLVTLPGYKVYKTPEEGTPPQYFEMKFVVNFRGEGKAKHLAADMKFMSRYPEVIADLENLKPMLEDVITRLLRRQTYTALNEDMGDDNLRKELLKAAREIADSNRIDPSLIEDVYLTRLVTQ